MLSKVLANRIKKVISLVIYEERLTFIHGRQILYDILIAKELMDEARKLKKIKYIFLKSILRRLLTRWILIVWMFVFYKMNYLTLWRKWIKECISTAATFVPVDGRPTTGFSFQ